MLQLEGKKVAITGGHSMVGRAVATELYNRGAIPKQISHNAVTDLLQYYTALTQIRGADYCIHCAGYNGNIGFNAKYPADIFYRTTQMALNVLQACVENNIQKVVSPLSSCAYPDTNILLEEKFWAGPPNESVEAHGLSKRNILAFCRQIHKQYGLKYVSVVFNTCYGPYDSYDVNKTKVVGGLIKKFYDAKINNLPFVECWGTGKPRREIIYVDDVAKGIVNALQYYDDPKLPLNIGSFTDISIKGIAEIIADVMEYKGKIVWDTSKPDGQFQKMLAPGNMVKVFKDNPIEFTVPTEGLKKTIDWYINEQTRLN